MAHDASQNNPKKEIAFALVGITAFLVIVLGIGISGFLRPAGNHEVATVSATEAGQKLEEALKAIEKPKAEENAAAEGASDSAPVDTTKTDSAEATDKPAEPSENTAEATAEATDTAKEEPAPTSTESETPKAE
ncbi:hypothetical protein [Moraxella oblonga]|uniref:hypothetical protein n=1 Tax=Moraxella oblonga TaxID=200413 RepID=UPI000832EC3F|nr:hypothetical protein [Moraxella oblonga]